MEMIEDELVNEFKKIREYLKKNNLSESLIDVVESRVFDVIDVYKDLLQTVRMRNETVVTFETSDEREKKLIEHIKQVDEFRLLKVDIEDGKIVVEPQNHNYNALYIDYILDEIAEFASKLGFDVEVEENIDTANRLLISE